MSNLATTFSVEMKAAGAQNFGSTSMLDGWLPLSVQVVALGLLVLAVGWRSRRWWMVWMPVVAAVGLASIFATWWYIKSEGLAGDPAPTLYWLWCGLTGAAVAVAVCGWRGAGWWRRAASFLSIPASLLCVVLLLNIWVGYVRTTQAAWNFLTAGPPPNQADLSTVTKMAHNGIVPRKGRIVPVTISAQASGFRHRGELVYLPPIWFTSATPPPLPVVMMIGGEFGTSGDWLWAGGAQDIADEFAAAHNGSAPVMVFVDKGGAFNKDTECVNGTRGNAADHLVKDVVPYMISTFGVSRDAANWGVAGWSMGGTCAIGLTVMHPEMFSAFVDIDGDLGPRAGTVPQTIDRLFDGDQAAWESFDPTTVMNRHGYYAGVSGVFAVEEQVNPQRVDPHRDAAEALSKTASQNGVDCSILEVSGKHDWAVGQTALEQTFGWLAGQLHTPDVASVPLPGTPVQQPARGIGGRAELAEAAFGPR